METIRKLRKLNHVRRCSSFPIIHETSVAEHSYHVALMCIFVAEEIKEGTGYEVDTSKLLKKALLHDVEEIITSDIPHPVKKYIRSGLRDFISSSTEFEECPNWLYNEIMNGHEDDSLESKIVKACDMAELVLYCLDEMKSGNTHVESMRDTALQVLRACNENIQSNYLKEIIEYEV